MAAPAPTRKHVVLTGLAAAHSELLESILSRHDSVQVLAGSLADLPPDLSAECVVVAGCEGLRESARQCAMRLRTERFIWQPIVLLLTNPSGQGVEDWSIVTEEMPPDIGRLQSIIRSSTPVPLDRQYEIVRFALLKMREDLVAVAGLRRDGECLQLGDARSILESVLADCEEQADTPYRPAMLALGEALKEALTSPELGQSELSALEQVVVAAEKAARDYEAPQRLRSDIHHLSNAVRFLSWSAASTADRLWHLHQVISSVPLDVADRLQAELGESILHLRHLLEPSLAVAIQTGDRPLLPDAEALAEAVGAFSAALNAVRVAEPAPADTGIRRILVIEDDDNWREAVLGLLARLGLADITSSAASVCDARALLQASPAATLALVDLGLPEQPGGGDGGVVELDAGLRLVREFSGAGNAPRFMVLTAAANYAEAVGQALAAGVDPWDYIQKGPQWQDQLASRVRLAMLPPWRPCPRVQIMRSTGRLVRVDGVEIELDRKPYVVLEYLASRAPRWCLVEHLRRDLSTPGALDITPPMGTEALDGTSGVADAMVTPYDLLSEARLQDYVYEVRKAIAGALPKTASGLDADALIEHRGEPAAYRLNARVDLLDSFEDLARRESATSVLVVEDDARWSEMIATTLGGLGFDVHTARTLEEAQQDVARCRPDLLSLDLQIPRNEAELAAGMTDEANSLALMDWLAANSSDVRIAVLTSIAWRDDVMLELLRRGVRIMDYISKQWDEPVERLARSLWRLMLEAERGVRLAASPDQARLHHVELDAGETSAFRVDGHLVSLAPGPARVFGALARSRNAPVDRELLKDALWPDPDEMPDDHDGALNTVMRRLRTAIGDATNDPDAGSDIIRGKGGVYWLQGVVGPCRR